MSLTQHLDRMRSDPDIAPNFSAWHHQPPAPPRLAPFPDSLDRRLVHVLSARGIEGLYSHQAEAVQAVLAGENVAVVTPAASGKTLCYNLAVLHTLLDDPEAAGAVSLPYQGAGAGPA